MACADFSGCSDPELEIPLCCFINSDACVCMDINDERAYLSCQWRKHVQNKTKINLEKFGTTGFAIYLEQRKRGEGRGQEIKTEDERRKT